MTKEAYRFLMNRYIKALGDIAKVIETELAAAKAAELEHMTHNPRHILLEAAEEILKTPVRIEQAHNS